MDKSRAFDFLIFIQNDIKIYNPIFVSLLINAIVKAYMVMIPLLSNFPFLCHSFKFLSLCRYWLYAYSKHFFYKLNDRQPKYKKT